MAAARWIVVTVLGLVLLAGAYVGELRFTGNFHTVIPHQLFRSGQLSATEIAEYAKEDGIKTIINLRGSNPRSDWYRQEVRESDRLGIAHIDFPMSARRELTTLQAVRLLALMKAAQKPILIHCQAGSDRTGLAAALYLMAVVHDSEAVAAEQLSFQFGHIALPISPEYAMDRSFKMLAPVFQSHRQ